MRNSPATEAEASLDDNGPLLPPIPDTNAENHPSEAARIEFLRAAGIHEAAETIVRAPSARRLHTLLESLDGSCAEAAKAILAADVILLATGAGWSADSGLPVYKDIANLDAYRKHGLEYHDLCVPSFLERDAGMYYGFWGMSFNAYRSNPPHDGYAIIQQWRAERPGRLFYSLTSNVDDHGIRAGFEPHLHHAIHGTTERWQCAKPCGRAVWTLDASHRFEINSDCVAPDSEANRPKCGYCGGEARPNVDMFNDPHYIENGPAFEKYHDWRMAALAARPLAAGVAGASRCVVLEIGCGFRVPTIRAEAEAFLAALGDRCTLVRINPDYPLLPPWAVDVTHAPAPEEVGRPRAISVCAGGLDALRRIDAAMRSTS